MRLGPIKRGAAPRRRHLDTRRSTMRTLRLEAVAAAVVWLVTLCGAFPTQIYKQATSPGAFIGEGINNIATALLQDTEQQGNAAFSPLGHSAILAALAEGASGKTRAQLLAALKLPQDSSLTRATYRSVLSRMKEKNAVSKPEFRSWFYVYKKSAQVEEPYTNMLRDNFLMEVRDIDAVELDTPIEFFTKKEQEVEADGQKLDEVEPIVNENKVSAIPVVEVQATPSALAAEEHKETVAAPIVEQEAPVAIVDEVPKKDKDQEAVISPPASAASIQDEPPKEVSAPQEAAAIPTPEVPAVPAVPATIAADPKPEILTGTTPEEGQSASDVPVAQLDAVKQDNKDEVSVPAVVVAEAPVKVEADDTPKQEQEVAKEPVALAEADKPLEVATAAVPQGVEEPALPVQDAAAAEPVKVADEPIPAKDSTTLEGAAADAPVVLAEKPEEPVKLAEEAAAAEKPATQNEASESVPEAPAKEMVIPATELLPPTGQLHKDDTPKTEDAPKIADPATPVKEIEPEAAKEPAEAVPELTQGSLPIEPSNELHKELLEEAPEKISLAKFSKQGLPKDEKKPTSVAKPDRKKDEKKKASRNAAEAETDGRQPASGPSLLTAFNALYYKGAWQTPFDAKFKDDFFVAEGVKKEVTTLRTQGDFRIGEIKELDARAIELPYKGENGRYSLLVLLPRAQDGLAKLTEALSRFSFRQLSKYLRQKHVEVTLPEFEIDCISHPQNVFRKLGVTAMLEKENAEFPGISKAQRLYLQDDAMAQLVRFRLDDETAVANYLSTMSMSTRSGNQVFQANHPFIFYLRDNLDNLTIVVGKVVDPSIRPDFTGLQQDE